MGSSASCDDSVSVRVGFTSCLYILNCEESGVKHEQYGHTEMKNMKEIFLEDVDSSSSSEEDEGDFDDLIVKDLDISLRETMHIQDTHQHLCVINPTLNQGSTYNQLDANPFSFETDVMEGLKKHATIVCSERLPSYPVNSDAGDELSCIIVESESFSEDESPAVLHPMHTATKLISALKGSRVQRGIHLDTKLSVKWAPEVYDPPVTSSSHTVKGHRHRHHHNHNNNNHHHHNHHRAKAKKDYPTSRYSKGKSARGIGNDRKQSHHRSSGSSPSDPRKSRLQAFGGTEPLPLLNSCAQSKVESQDLGVGSLEAIKYGSSCYLETLPQVQLPAAKAS